MFVFIMDRARNTHIVDFKNSQGKFRTVCGKNFFQKDIITTLGADNTFHGICKTCKNNFDDLYLLDLNNNLQMVRSVSEIYSDIIKFHRHDFIGPRALYEDVFYRRWTKLNRAKSMSKSKTNKYYGK